MNHIIEPVTSIAISLSVLALTALFIAGQVAVTVKAVRSLFTKMEEQLKVVFQAVHIPPAAPPPEPSTKSGLEGLDS